MNNNNYAIEANRMLQRIQKKWGCMFNYVCL